MRKFLRNLFGISGKSASTRKHRARLSCENLETREVPAVSITQIGTTLVVSSDAAADRVHIRMNDAAGTISVGESAAVGSPVIPRGVFSGVTKLDINMGGGDDYLECALDSDATIARTMAVKLGTGHDEAWFDFGKNQSHRVNADLDLLLHAEGGNDTVRADFGVMQMNRLTATIDMSDGFDYVEVKVWGDLLAGNAKFVMNGGNQNDVLRFHDDHNLAAGTSMTVNQHGQNSNDLLDVYFDGIIGGYLRVTQSGGSGDDVAYTGVWSRYVPPAPAGSLYVEVKGNDGADQLGLHLTLEGSIDRMNLIDAILDGGVAPSGQDVDGDSLLYGRTTYQVRLLNMG